tara:strand:+ start:569 stop:1021 length:453 start_codon:yes stop_codon:yes gene_type:complete
MFNKTNASSSAAVEDSKKTSSTPAPRVSSAPSILGRDLIITGDLKTDGDVQIDGRVDGNVHAGNITIGEQGIINGKIVAKSVHVRGKITGKVDAGSIELAETANVQADLVQDQLMIANGAFFDGKCARKTAPGTAPKAVETSKSAQKKAS